MHYRNNMHQKLVNVKEIFRVASINKSQNISRVIITLVKEGPFYKLVLFCQFVEYLAPFEKLSEKDMRS